MASEDVFEMFTSDDKGRGLRCEKKILKSQLVMTTEPFVYVLSKTQKGMRCDHCFRKYVI